MAKDLMHALLGSLDPLCRTMDALALGPVSNMMTRGGWNNEIQVRSPVVEKQESSDLITERKVQDGQNLLSLSRSSSVELVPIGDIITELGEDSASPGEIEVLSGVHVVILDSNVSDNQLEDQTGMETVDPTAENGPRSPIVGMQESFDQIIEDFFQGGQIPPLASLSKSGPGSTRNVSMDGVTVDSGYNSSSPSEIESTNYVGIEVSSLNPLEEQTGVETVDPCITNGACQTHYGMRCDDCGSNPVIGPMFRSCNILSYSLCLQCFRATRTTRGEYTMIDLFYFDHPTSLERMMPASSPELESDSALSGGETIQQQTHETRLPIEDFTAKLGEAACEDPREDHEPKAELFERNNLSLHNPSEDLGAMEGWDAMIEELQDFGYSDVL